MTSRINNLKRGAIVRCVEKPGYLQGFSRGNEYVVCDTFVNHGATYIKILGEDDHGHSLLADMFRLVEEKAGAAFRQGQHDAEIYLKAEAATIERCAKVAEWEGYATVGRQIAAEIRAMKDKP